MCQLSQLDFIFFLNVICALIKKKLFFCKTNHAHFIFLKVFRYAIKLYSQHFKKMLQMTFKDLKLESNLIWKATSDSLLAIKVKAK